MFDLSFFKLAILAVVALVIFGPERLPALAAQAGRTLRELRRIAEGAKADLQDSLGPEFSDFDLADLNPRYFVRKHLISELTGDGTLPGGISDGDKGAGPAQTASQAPMVRLAPGETPPYDSEAT